MLPQILRSERTILFVPLLSDTYSPEGKGAVPTIINKKPLRWCFDLINVSLMLTESSFDGRGISSGCECQSPT